MGIPGWRTVLVLVLAVSCGGKSLASLRASAGEDAAPSGASRATGVTRLIVDALLALRTKGVRSVSVCACWGREERLLLREMSSAGVPVRFLRGAARTRAAVVEDSLRRQGHRVAVLVDTACPAAPRLLAMVSRASRLRLFSASIAWLILDEGLFRRLWDDAPSPSSDSANMDFADWDSVPAVRVGAHRRESALRDGDSLLFEVPAPRPPTIGPRGDPGRPGRPGLSPRAVSLLVDHVILTDSEVRWLQPGRGASVHLYDVFRTSPAREPQAYHLSEGDTASGTWTRTLRPREEENEVERMKWDLEGAAIRAPVVVNSPESYISIEDNAERRNDLYVKINFPLVKLMAEKMNFNLLLLNMSDYGYTVDSAGRFAGAIGTLQRYEVDMLATSIQPREERLPVMDMVAETYTIRTGAVYRQTSHGHAVDMFVKPFSREVWAAVAVVSVGSAALLLAATHCGRGRLRPDTADAHVSTSDCVTCVVGVLCQQGSYYAPDVSSARLAIVTFLLANVFIYNAFSASILAQSQAPSEPLASPDSLLRSTFGLGAEDMPWVHYWFKTERREVIGKLFRKKIKKHERPGFLSPSEGLAKVRRGGYAFQIDLNVAWLNVQDTFLEHEKCDLHVMGLFPDFVTVLVAVKMSPYREAMSRIVRWLRETGHVDRTSRRWLTPQPVCQSRSRGFTAMGLREAVPPLTLVACGAAASVLVLLAELAWHKVVHVNDHVDAHVPHVVPPPRVGRRRRHHYRGRMSNKNK